MKLAGLRSVPLSLALAALVVVTGGCMLFCKSPGWAPPKAKAAVFVGPAGRSWTRSLYMPEDGGFYAYFTPTGADASQWKEKIDFSRSSDESPEKLRRAFEKMIEEEHLVVKYSFEDLGGGSTLCLSDFVDLGKRYRVVSKIVKVRHGWATISYETRLGPEGDAAFERWIPLIRTSRPQSAKLRPVPFPKARPWLPPKRDATTFVDPDGQAWTRQLQFGSDELPYAEYLPADTTPLIAMERLVFEPASEDPPETYRQGYEATIRERNAKGKYSLEEIGPDVTIGIGTMVDDDLVYRSVSKFVKKGRGWAIIRYSCTRGVTQDDRQFRRWVDLIRVSRPKAIE